MGVRGLMLITIFEEFTIPSLLDFVDRDRDEMRLCSIVVLEVLEQD